MQLGRAGFNRGCNIVSRDIYNHSPFELSALALKRIWDLNGVALIKGE